MQIFAKYLQIVRSGRSGVREFGQSLRWALRDRSRHYRALLRRRRLTKTSFIGITGSAGKTSTKDFVTHLLSVTGDCHTAAGTKNEHGALDRLILSVRAAHRHVVAEMSATRPGYLDRSIRTVRPRIGVLTVIAAEHYSAFRSLEAIAAEKRKVIDALPADGVAVLNRDDALVRAIGESCRCRVIWVGRDEGAAVRLIEARSKWPEPLTLVIEHEGQRHELVTQLHGVQLATPLLCALGVGLAAGMPMAAAVAALAGVTSTEGRMQVVSFDDGVTFVRDDFKAPQWSLQAPLDFMRDARASRRIVVFGTITDSLEGPSRRYGKAARAGLAVADLVLLVGSHTLSAERASRICGDGSLRVFTAIGDAAVFLRSELRRGDLVLLKGINKKDHLVRLLLDRRRPVQCWDPACEKFVFCDECQKLYAVDPHGIAAGMPDRPVPGPEHPTSGLDESRSDFRPRLVVGLGNPGEQYRNTVHNVAQRLLDRMVERAGGSWVVTGHGQEARIDLDGVSIVLLKFDRMMNRSGAGLEAYLREHRRTPSDCIVVLDDTDLPAGSARIKRGGGDAGHRGMRSVIEALSTDAIVRVRIGVRPAQQDGKALDFVLSRIDPDGEGLAGAGLRAAEELVRDLVHEGRRDGPRHVVDAARREIATS